jgi:FixJ family two-component response regulator
MPYRTRVLVVDDDEDMVHSLVALLAIQGYKAKGLYSASSIISAVRDFDPDVIIMDIAMPGIAGGMPRKRFASIEPENGPC